MLDTIHINGTDYSDVIDGLETIPIEVRLNQESKTLEIGITGDLTFRGRAYDLITTTFFTGCFGKSNKLEGTVFFDDICIERDFVIRYEQVDWDPCACDATVSLKIESKNEADCYRYLSSKAFWENGFIDAFTHPKIHYCSQPGFLHAVFMWVLLPIICPILIFLKTIEIILKVMGTIVNALDPFNDPIDVDAIDLDVLDNIDDFILGCGKVHVAPMLKEIFEYHTGKCGMQFKSSILANHPVYRNTAILLAQNEKGVKYSTTFNWIDENRWNISPIQLLQKISLAHNADFRLKNGQLIYERWDYFLTDFAPASINLIDLCADGSIDELAYEITGGGNAYGKYEYTQDADDAQGNRNLNDYNDIVDWNDPVKDHLSGEFRNTVEFSPARFMFDKHSSRQDGFFDFDKQIDKMRNGSLIAFCVFVGRKRQRDLILESETSSQVKLLALEPGTNRDEAQTVRTPLLGVPGFYDYNYPYYFDSEYHKSELYQNFHNIDDPNLSLGVYYEIPDDVTILMTKEIVEALLTHGTDVEIITHVGSGKATEGFVIDREKKQVVLSGIKIPCQ